MKFNIKKITQKQKLNLFCSSKDCFEKSRWLVAGLPYCNNCKEKIAIFYKSKVNEQPLSLGHRKILSFRKGG